MREQFGNVWDMPGDAICVTTNLTVKQNGEAVMGGGVARECAERFPDIPRLLGQKLYDGDNGVTVLGSDDVGVNGGGRLILAYPTKDNVWEKSKPWLIYRSTVQLLRLADLFNLKQVLLPRPGCGLGGLNWDEIGPWLGEMLDDRFIAVGYERETK